MDFVKKTKRTHYCGDLNASHVGQTVVLMGWVDNRRDHGGLIFVDLRDREGLVQVVINPSENPSIKEIRNEWVLAIQGEVVARPDAMVNKKLKTGEIEIQANVAGVLSKAETPPFSSKDKNVTETTRLKYRYLDLRQERLQGFLKTRHEVAQLARQYLNENAFLEVETPILYKSTPEGARDYLVPSRVHLGEFYALPQSPQTLKQLLMVAGFDRYYQIARCFRDEDLRADRQPEFSQIDIEMSFVDQEDVIAMNEGLAKKVWKQIKGIDLPDIPRMTWQQAMDEYGIDRPDLRNPLKLKDLMNVVKDTEFKVFQDVLGRGGVVRGLAVPKAGDFSRARMDKLTDLAKRSGAKGLVWIKADASENLTTPIAKFFEESKLKEIFKAAGGEPNGAVFIVADDFEVACSALSSVRLELGQELDLIDKSQDRFVWITDFPALEYDAEQKRWVARHHPFTSPSEEGMDILVSGDQDKFGSMTAKAYDLVCNGYEIAGGSIRIHQSDVQDAMFRALGLTPEEVVKKFGFFVEALKYGTPPHGGIAWGMDRLVMILCETDAIREVIAFPKTTKAYDVMSQTPSTVSQDQLLELSLRLGVQAEKALSEKNQN
ncbi:MAG: aspartate--tRNA ligase [Bdellovibrionaceae bacterium]|nr:aspartate--tRNA ligase [Pseudobdellovibrionaceae bacterium]